jgi:hypothetical protein
VWFKTGLNGLRLVWCGLKKFQTGLVWFEKVSDWFEWFKTGLSGLRLV